MIDEIITEVLRAEGWDKYTDHPADRGGPTKWGITQKAWSDFLGFPVTADDVRGIEEQQARDFYSRQYVQAPGFHLLPDRLVPLVVDCGVNHGVSRATKWLQQALGVSVDGVLGRQTRTAAHALPWRTTYLRICATRVRFYGEIVANDHSQAVFAKGWMRRAAKFIDAFADAG